MPNLKSGFKRMKTSAANRERNRSGKGEVATVRAQFLQVVASGNKESAMKLFRQYCSVVDTAAKRGIIKANNASRCKSRAAAKLVGLGAAAPVEAPSKP
jgi:small subunit ribosomal protein S20